MDRYWIMVNKKLQGPYEVSELMALPEFQQKMLVCRQGDDSWKAAQEFSAIRQRLMIATDQVRTMPAPAPKTPLKTSGDFISPDFQFAHFNPVKASAPRLSNPATVPAAPPRPVVSKPAPKAVPPAKGKPLAKKRRVFVIAVLSLLVMTGHLMVSFAGMPISGLLMPYQSSPRKILGTRFSQRAPHPAGQARKAKTSSSTELSQWVLLQAKKAAPTRVTHRPWFSKAEAASRRAPARSHRRSKTH